MANFVEILTFVEGQDPILYEMEFNQTIRQLLSSIGWVLPRLTNAEVASFTSIIPRGAQWYNTDLNKMQIRTAGGVETITSV